MTDTDYCSFCGSSIESGSQFCPNCGASISDVTEPSKATLPTYTPPPPQESYGTTPVYEQPPTTVYTPQSRSEGESLGVLALIFGAMSCIVFPIFAIPAVILGHISLSKSKTPMAIIGLVLGYIVIAVAIGLILWFTLWW